MTLDAKLPLEVGRVIGEETEYALPIPESVNYSSIFRDAFDKQYGIHVPAHFTANGSRHYLDCELIEYATPECTTSSELLRAHFAGQTLSIEIANSINEAIGHQSFLQKRTLARGNNSRADHENYYIRGAKDARTHYMPFLVGHLATRVILTGPGALISSDGSDSFLYHIDQRSYTTKPYQDLSLFGKTTRTQKPFFTHRPSDNFDITNMSQRLNVLSGSQNMFAAPIALRFICTSSVLRMIEHGTYPTDLYLADPYYAINQAGGPNGLTAKLELSNNQRYTAAEFQASLAEAAFTFLQGKVPKDEEEILLLWAEMATDVANGELEKWESHIEWFAKKQLLGRAAERYHFSPNSADAAVFDLKWHLPEGSIYKALRKNKKIALMPDEVTIDHAKEIPPSTTRAARRSALIRDARDKGLLVTSCDWHEVTVDGKTTRMSDAYQVL